MIASIINLAPATPLIRELAVVTRNRNPNPNPNRWLLRRVTADLCPLTSGMKAPAVAVDLNLLELIRANSHHFFYLPRNTSSNKSPSTNPGALGTAVLVQQTATTHT